MHRYLRTWEDTAVVVGIEVEMRAWELAVTEGQEVEAGTSCRWTADQRKGGAPADALHGEVELQSVHKSPIDEESHPRGYCTLRNSCSREEVAPEKAMPWMSSSTM